MALLLDLQIKMDGKITGMISYQRLKELSEGILISKAGEGGVAEGESII